MNVDEIFKAPAPKVGNVHSKNKRKFTYDFTPDPAKKVRDDGERQQLSAKAAGKQRATTMEDLPPDNDDGVERLDYTGADDSGPAYDFAPGGDADYFAEEDEDGRFFGGGLTGEQKEILGILDQDKETDEGKEMGVADVKKSCLALEKAVNKNREMRTRFPSEPAKFVDSEFNLTEAIQSMALLTQNPAHFYPQLISLSTVSTLLGLLSHENPDIGIGVVEVLEELTDEDVLEVGDPAEEADEDEAKREEGRRAVEALVQELLKHQALELLVSMIQRLNEDEESERNGVFHMLGLIENLVSLHVPITPLLATSTSLIPYLLNRLSLKSSPSDAGFQNRSYASELLAILVSADLQARERVVKEGGMDRLLLALAAYRKKDPVDSIEMEFMENLFDALCSILLLPGTRALFLEGEGVELMVLMMKEKKLAKARAVKVLDHALAGEEGGECCERFVDALGLKTLFSAFMGKSNKGKRPTNTTHEDDEHILGLISSLLYNLPSDSAPRLRLLAKFVESSYEKVDRLLEMRGALLARVQQREGELAGEKQLLEAEGLELDEVDEYLRRLEAGLFSLHLCDTVLGWLVMEDDGIRDHAKMLLQRQGSTFDDVAHILKEYKDNIGDGSPGAIGGSSKNAQMETETGSAGLRQREAIAHLIEYLMGISRN